jgi:hypothetical protein
MRGRRAHVRFFGQGGISKPFRLDVLVPVQRVRRADERARTAYPCSLRVIGQALQGFTGVANAAYLSRLLFCRLPRVAPYCVPGGVRVVSGGRGFCVADPFTLDGRAREEEGLNTPSYASYPTTSSSCPSCAFGGIIANARSRSQHIAGFFT